MSRSDESNKGIDQTMVNNPLSFSVIQEYHQDNQKLPTKQDRNNVSSLLKNKRKTVWAEDKYCTNCTRCGIEFTILLRRHHCRFCNAIFCDDCSSVRKKIPDFWDEKYRMGKHRVCLDCSPQIDIISGLEKPIKVFSLIKPDIKMLSDMSLVCRDWYNVSQYFMGQIRNLQYKNMSDELTPLEKELLWINRDYWIGHTHYTLLLLRSLDYNSYEYRTKKHEIMKEYLEMLNTGHHDGERFVNCMHLMCTRNCFAELLPMHAIILMDYASYNSSCRELDRLIMRTLQRVNQEEFRYYLPYIVEVLSYQRVDHPNSWGDFIISRCQDDPRMAMEFYWNLHYAEKTKKNHNYRFFMDKLLHSIPPSYARRIQSSFKLMKILENIPKSRDLYEIKNYFRKVPMRGLVLPFDSTLSVDMVYVHQISVKNSATAPLCLPLRCTKTTEEGEQYTLDYTLLLKFENVRQDYMILKVIRLMKYLLKHLEDLDLEMVDYYVRPYDENSGLIQVIPNCKTIYEVRLKEKFSLWNYIVENNPRATVDELRQKFVKSCATYCVITYLLGVGDRHLDNIMITQDGKLFHIDYSFILGADPKPLSQPKIRITQEMIDVLGGHHSHYYADFLNLCNRIFQGLRGHLNLFTCLLSLLCKDDYEYRKMADLLTSRFMPGGTQKTAIVQLEKEIFRSTQQQNLSEQLIDFFHYHNKEHTIQTVLDSTQSVASNAITQTSHLGKKVSSTLGSTISHWWYGSSSSNEEKQKNKHKHKSKQ